MNAKKYFNHILKKDSPDYDAEMEETLKNDLEAAKEELADALQKNNTTDKYGNITVKNYVDIINKMQKVAREFKDNAANLKVQKICPSCEREVDITVSFCPYCGTPCPTPEPAQDVEGEAVQDEETDDGSNGTEEVQTEEQSEEVQTEEPAADAAEEPAQEQPVEEQPKEEPVEEQSEQETTVEEKTEE